MAVSPEPTDALPPHVHIEAIQSVTPMQVTEPRQARRVAVGAGALSGGLLASHLRMVLYYRPPAKEETGWTAAGWLKDSLNVALLEQPLLAGRLRRGGGGDGEGGLELRLNDAGVRLVQAQAETAMSEFLAGEDREAKEAHLAYWVDPDEKNPQFSALFYVQVTRFQDDGYSIGISCSVLLADPLFVLGFLRRWAQIHVEMKAQDRLPKVPIFFLGSFKRAGRATHLSSKPLDSILGDTHRTILFEFPAGAPEQQAFIAAAAAAKRAGEKATPEFSLIAARTDRLKELKVDELCVNEVMPMSNGSFKGSLHIVDWDQLCTDGLAFGEDNKPVRVSCHIDSGASRALVLVMPPLEQGGSGLISVTLPKA